MVTKYAYNLAGQCIERRHPDKGTTTYHYDQAGNISRLVTDNLLNDPSVSSNFIEYIYNYNRLIKIILPDLPNGNTNPNNVIYTYGQPTAGNNAGRMISKSDGSGETAYKYGRMGEVISETRMVRGHHIPEMYFKTYFNYDSWNRLTKIKYPDNEIVSYHYDKGGNLKSVDNNYGETLIEKIHYNYYGQRSMFKNGNGVMQYYHYNYQNRRLDQYYLMANENQTMLSNTYKYDQFANTSMIQNEAAPLANGLGGAFQFNLNYDTLNRLIGTETRQIIIRDKEDHPMPTNSYAPSTYHLNVKYNNVGGIVIKQQHHERDQSIVPENTYENRYNYIPDTHKLRTVNDNQTGNTEDFRYDDNGNAVFHTDAYGTKQMFWDEQDRLRAFYNENSGVYQYYTYDDKGDRTIKYGLEIPTQLYQNGAPVESNEMKLFEYKLYPNPYITVSSTGQYTKHYFEGSRRFASRLMDGAEQYKDPSVLHTNRTADEKPAGKPADVKSDFEKYLEKSGLGDGISVELRERPWYTGLYYLHGDHLGTATFVTNSQAEATQFFVNLPFGETMYEKMDGSYDNPFKFNGKELDEETGLYYYGARYYNPRLSIWYGVDPLADKYPSLSPYVYVANNPVNLIDPDGQSWEPFDKKGNTVKVNDYDNIHGYRWVDYDTDKNGNKVARANTIETAYIFGEGGMTTLSSEGYKANQSWQAYEDISTGSESTDKKIASLHPSIQNQMKSFILKAKYRYDIDLRVTDGFRSVEEQDKLYSKGRTAPGSIVTKARGGYSNHNFGLAVDVVPMENGKLNWETNNWDIIGRIGESRGLEWGGRWKFLDRPHFQNLQGKTLQQLRALPKNKGLPILAQ